MRGLRAVIAHHLKFCRAKYQNATSARRSAIATLFAPEDCKICLLERTQNEPSYRSDGARFNLCLPPSLTNCAHRMPCCNIDVHLVCIHRCMGEDLHLRWSIEDGALSYIQTQDLERSSSDARLVSRPSEFPKFGRLLPLWRMSLDLLQKLGSSSGSKRSRHPICSQRHRDQQRKGGARRARRS